MGTIVREHIESADKTVTLEIPEEWRGKAVDIEIREAPTQRPERAPDPDYNPDWKIGDTLHLIDKFKHLRGSFTEGMVENLYGSAPDLEIESMGPVEGKFAEWLD